MKFIVEPNELLGPIVLVSLISSPRSPDPTGGAVRLKLEGDKLWFLLVGHSASIRCSIDVRGEEDGEVGVDLGMLRADVVSMRSTITAHSTEKSLILKAGRSRRRRPLIPLDQFTREPNVKGNTQQLDSQSLVGALRDVSFAAIKDESRPELKCVRVGGGVAMGANGQVFACSQSDLELDISIPIDICAVITHVLSGVEEVACTVGKWMKLETGTCTLKISLLNYPYPDGARAVKDKYDEKSPTLRMQVDRKVMLSILSSLSVYAERGKMLGIEYVTLDFDKGYPRLIADVSDVGLFEDEVPLIEMEGTFDKFLFSPSLLFEIFSHAKGPELEMLLFSPIEPMLIRDPTNDGWEVIQSAMGTRDTVQKYKEQLKEKQNEEEEDF